MMLLCAIVAWEQTLCARLSWFHVYVWCVYMRMVQNKNKIMLKTNEIKLNRNLIITHREIFTVLNQYLLNMPHDFIHTHTHARARTILSLYFISFCQFLLLSSLLAHCYCDEDGKKEWSCCSYILYMIPSHIELAVRLAIIIDFHPFHPFSQRWRERVNSIVFLLYFFIVVAFVYFHVDVGVHTVGTVSTVHNISCGLNSCMSLDIRPHYSLQKSNNNSKKEQDNWMKKLNGYTHHYYRIHILSSHRYLYIYMYIEIKVYTVIGVRVLFGLHCYSHRLIFIMPSSQDTIIIPFLAISFIITPYYA